MYNACFYYFLGTTVKCSASSYSSRWSYIEGVQIRTLCGFTGVWRGSWGFGDSVQAEARRLWSESSVKLGVVIQNKHMLFPTFKWWDEIAFLEKATFELSCNNSIESGHIFSYSCLFKCKVGFSWLCKSQCWLICSNRMIKKHSAAKIHRKKNLNYFWKVHKLQLNFLL